MSEDLTTRAEQWIAYAERSNEGLVGLIADWMLKDSVKTNEINILTAENRRLIAEVTRLREEQGTLQADRARDKQQDEATVLAALERAESAEATVATLRDTLQDWLTANAPGGWIDDYRQKAQAYDRLATTDTLPSQ